MSPKKVAIIGAGPSGLVTAKTLLHNFPSGQFAPVVFDSRQEVGGLWNTYSSRTQARSAGHPVTLDPRMRTNLSRFTVAFSDLSWESVLKDVDIPMFPQASQVGQYLKAYAERYIPKDVLRLGSFVRDTKRMIEANPSTRSTSTKWRVFWDKNSPQSVPDQSSPGSEENFEDFDYLVVASGYFARPHIPKIPGLAQFTGRVIHSSALPKCHDACNDEDLSRGNIVVLGGSMSGVEAASTFALHHSTLRHRSTSEKDTPTDRTIYHISSRPFWTLPTYLPHVSPSSNVTFLPLDLAMYDLGRRPPGPVEYYLGPIPKEKVAKTNAYFHSLLGNEYEKFGHVHEERSEASDPRPPWVAIGNDYAGFVQSNTIVPKIGRAVSINPDPINKLAAVKFETEEGEIKTIDDIASIVMATGFSPFESLSFLPQDILTTLEYTTDDSFLPLVLDQGGSIRSEIPDLGFVGYYRGPYWAAMEMQARFLGKTWTQEREEPAIAELQRQNIRLLRQPSTQAWRGQFPMGDYVGLMESFAKDLGIERTELQDIEGPGPVIPARYIYHDRTHLVSDQSQGQRCNDSQLTLDSLSFLGLDNAISAVNDSPETQNAIAMAIFRSLHGAWKFTKRGYIGEMAGTMTFYPRYPTDDAYDKEYICEEVASESTEAPQSPKQTIWRLSEAGGTSFPISIYSMETAESESGGRDPGYLKLLSTRNEKNGSIDQSLTVDFALDRPVGYILEGKEDQYKFWLDGVSILSWEISHTENSLDSDMSITHTVYTRV